MKTTSTPALLKGLAAMALCTANLNANTVASWATFGSPGNQASTPGTGSANVTADAIIRGPGIIASAANNSLSSSGWESLPNVNPSSDLEYIQFGFDVAPGFEVSLEDLFIGTRSSATGPGTLGVFTSLDGFTAPIHTLVQNNTAFLNSQIDLTGLGFITGPFDVRLIEIGNTQADGVGATASGGTFRVGDYFDGSAFSLLRFTGTTRPVATVSVPDGGLTFAMLGLGFAGLVAVRRRLRA